MRAVVAAAQRASEGVLRETRKLVEAAQLNATSQGRLGSSRFVEIVSDFCEDGFADAAQAASEAIVKHDQGGASLYRESFIAILDATLLSLTELWQNSVSPSLDGVLHDPNVLQNKLSPARAAALAEFDLIASAPQQTKADENGNFLQLAILRCFSSGHAHRITVLGRSSEPGRLETVLGKRFTSVERAEAGGVLNDLLQKGLLAPSHRDYIAPEDWLETTLAGQEALKRTFLDSLDEALAQLDLSLVSMRHGARAAALRGEPDSVRQAAHSARELITQTLDLLAPVEQIRLQPWYQPDSTSSTGVTRRMRLKLAVQIRGAGNSDNDRLILQRSSDLLDAMYKKLSAEAHSRGGSPVDIHTYLSLTEMMLKQLLL